jgi:hypothetical protein
MKISIPDQEPKNSPVAQFRRLEPEFEFPAPIQNQENGHKLIVLK